MRRRSGIIAVFAVGAALAAASATPAPGATITNVPVADATVFAGGRSTASQRVLLVGGRPAARAFLRWQLPRSYDGLQRATLRLYTPTGGRGFRIHTGSDSWSERSIRGRKPRASQLAGSVAVARPRSWIQLDVTRFVRAGGSLSFVVSKAGAQTRLTSREGAAAFRPRLLVALNAAPVCVDGAGSTNEDTTLAARLSCTDDGGALTYRQTAGPAHGGLTLGADGSYTYAPAPNFNGADEFGFEACDSGRRCAGGRVRIQVAAVNDAPTAAPVSVTTAEDTPVQLALGGSDPDGDPLSVSAADPPHGSIAGSTYTPDANYSGPDSFAYAVSDGKGGIATATVSLNVTPVNDLPVASDLALSTTEDVAKALTLQGTDVESAALNYSVVMAPAKGQLSGTGADRTYTPNANANGPDSFTYKVSDGSGDSNLATVSISVAPVNDAPVLNTTGTSTLTPIDENSANPAGDSVLSLVGDRISDVDAGALEGIAVTSAPDVNGSWQYSLDSGASWTSLGSPTNGAARLLPSTAAAKVRFVPQAGFVGEADLDYRAWDQSAGAAGATMSAALNGGTTSFSLAVHKASITVRSTNQPPVAVDDVCSGDEDEELIVAGRGVLANDTDPNGDNLAAVVLEEPDNGELALNANGSFTYTPDPNFHGTDSFSYRAVDGRGGSDEGSVTLTITAVNDAPTPRADAATTAEDTAKTVDVVANDVDVDGDAPLTLTSAGTPSNGSASVVGGQLRYTPAANFHGADSVSYTVSDGNGGSATGLLSLTVTPANDAPSAVADSATTPEDTTKTVDVAANDTDIDGDSLTLASVGTPSQGAAEIEAGKLRYTPPANYVGPASVGYTVSDGNGGSANGTLSLTVTPVNDAPTAAPVSVTTNEDAPGATVTLAGSDVDGDALTYTVVTNPSKGSVSNGTGSARTYTPTPNLNGPDSFTYKVSDGTLESGVATVSVTITPVNDAPVLNTAGTPMLTAIPEDATSPAGDSVPAILATGAGGDPISDVDEGAVEGIAITTTPPPTNGAWQYSLDSGGTWNALGAVTNGSARLLYATPETRVRFIPSANYNGPAQFTFRAWDRSGGQANGAQGSAALNGTIFPFSGLIETVTITVTAVNDVPVATDDSATTGEDTSKAITLQASDVDVPAQPLTFSIVDPPDNGVLSGSGANRTYIPNANYSGPDSFQFTVSDGTATSLPATVSITVTSVNDPPVAQAQSVATDQGVAKTITLVATDVEGSTLTFSKVVDPTGGTLSPISGNQVVYTPAAGFSGPDSFTFKANDGGLDSNVATVSITVRGDNEPPVANDNSYSVAEDATLTVAAPGVLGNDTDADGDALTAARVSGPANGSLTLNANGGFGYTPDANYHGLDSFTYRANDGRDNSSDATVSITVTPVEDAPVCLPRSLVVDEDGSGTVAPSCIDPEGGTLTFSIESDASKGTAFVDEGVLHYVPQANASGADSFTYAANDGTATGAAATVSVTINPSNDAPEAFPQELSTPEGTAKTVTLEGFDEEGSALTFSVATLPAGGDLFAGTSTAGHRILPAELPYALAGDKVTYRPAATFTGRDAFQFTAHDGTEASLPAEIGVDVVGVNAAPVCSTASFSVEEDSELLERVCDDADGDDLTFIKTGPSHGSLTLFEDGFFSYVPNADYVGPDSFTVTATDPSGASSSTVTVSITVTPANDGPSCRAVTLTTDEDVAATTLPDCEDPDADVLSYSIVAQGGKGTASVTSADALRYQPAADANGSDSFTYTAHDGVEASTPVQVTVQITPVNDAPQCLPVTLATNEDVAGSVLPDCDDPEGATLTYSVAAAARGTSSVSGGQLRYMPNANVNGTDAFTYQASDGSISGAPAQVDVSISPVNDAPIAIDDVKAATEDQELRFAASQLVGNDSAGAANEGGETLTVTAVSAPVGGTVALDGGDVVFTPAPDFNGDAGFAYTVADNGTTNGAADAKSDTGAVAVTVSAVNDAPTAAADTKTTGEDSALTFAAADLVGNDAKGPSNESGQSLTVISVQDAVNGSVWFAGGDVTFTPAANFSGLASFTYTVHDNGTTNGAADPKASTGSVSMTVTPVNDAPVPVDGSETVAEDGSVTITLAAVDPEADPVSFTVPASADHGTLTNLGGGQVLYEPAADYNGTDFFTFTASDGTDDAVGRVDLSVTPVNDAPALDASGSPLLSPVNANASDPAGETVADILASGAGGDPISDVDTGDPDGIAVVGTSTTGGEWQYDSTGSTGWSSLAGASGTSARLLGPEARIRFVPSGGLPGTRTVDFRAWDQSSGSSGDLADTTTNGGTTAFSQTTETATIAVTAVVNAAPVAEDDNVTTPEDMPVNIDVLDNDTDADGDTLTISDLSAADDGTVEVDVDGTVLYQPDPDTNGSDRFTYTIEDGNGNSATAEVDVIVDEVNDIPIARDDVERVAEDGIVVFDPTVNDVGGPFEESSDPLAISAVTGPPGHGTAVAPTTGPDAGKIRYTPAAGYDGSDVLVYEICETSTADSFCAEAAVDLTVSPVTATVETAPTPHSADSADDPAIWVNPADPAESVVIATNKWSDATTNGGLFVYDLEGNLLQYLADGRMNNVDLRDGFELGGQETTLVVAGQRDGGVPASPKRIWIYGLNPTTRELAPVHRATPIVAGFEPLGMCMYRSRISGDFFTFVVGKGGQVEQWRLFEAAGVVDATMVRQFTVPDSSPIAGDVTEGCVADDELGYLYIGEEDAGILKYSAEPDGATTGTRVDVVGEGHMVADVEGLTIAYGPGDTGYLIASSQGNNSYAVYRRDGDNEFVRSFKIKQGTHDATSDTDGIDVTTADLGPDFPRGLFVAQDGSNTLPAANQNYKLVPLEQLFETAGLGANGACARPYADSSPWNMPIAAGATVSDDTDVHIGTFADSDPFSSDPTQYTYPVYETDPDTTLETVTIEPNGWFSNVTDGGRTLVNQRAGTVQIPIPAGAVAAAGGDAQLIVHDPLTGDEWGLSHARQDASGNWTAWNAYHYNTRWSAVPPYTATGKPFFPRGAGLPYLAGLVRPCELERRRIDHALAFAYDFPTAEFVYPATKSDGDSPGFPDMPEGSRLQLDPALSAADLATLGCTGHCLTIARALQQYGMYIIDNSGRPKVMLEFEGTAAWGGAVNSSTVSPIPLSAFQLLEP